MMVPAVVVDRSGHPSNAILSWDGRNQHDEIRRDAELRPKGFTMWTGRAAVGMDRGYADDRRRRGGCPASRPDLCGPCPGMTALAAPGAGENNKRHRRARHLHWDRPALVTSS